MVKGKVEEREDRLSLIVDSITPITDEPTINHEPSTIDQNTIVIPRGTSKATLFELNKLLQDNRGDDSVTLIFQNGHSDRELKLPFGIKLDKNLRNKVKKLIDNTTS